MSVAGNTGALNGPRKAAVLMALLGEDAAALVFRHLSPSDVQQIAAELAALGPVPQEVAHQVLDEYHRLSSNAAVEIRGGVELTTRLLNKAFGPEQASSLVQETGRVKNESERFAWLRKADPERLVAFLQREHPQTVALILGHVDVRQASVIVSRLPNELRVDVVRRVAQLRQFSPEVAETISSVLNRKLRAQSQVGAKSTKKTEAVSELMNHLEPTTAKSILDAIEMENAELATEIRNLMFTFEDFARVPQASLRDWLATLDKKSLAMALKGASETVRNHIFGTMSSRAVEMLKEDIEAMGPVRARDVTKAQQEAVAAARVLEAQGKLVLNANGGDDEFIS
jgi:flagellar motor switch protein FliG